MADGEDPGVATDRVDRHLVGCEACRAFAVGLEAISATARQSTLERMGDPAPGLTARIVTRLTRERLVGSPAPATVARAPRPMSIWRIGLVALAVGQLLAALPALAGSGNANALHANHDLGAVELALSACFLLAAVRPWRAAGFVPLLAAVVAFLALVAVADVASGRIAASSELPHLVDALGLAMLIAVARRDPAPVVRAGMA
jgi:predicted anti-sigma-YlaC factor YlaD